MPTFDLRKTLAKHLDPEHCEALAKASGFQRRKAKKISPALLLEALLQVAMR